MKRPVVETAFGEWCKRNKLTAHAFGKKAGLTTRAVLFYQRGQCVPTLVVAYRIEAFTDGAVPAASWLALPIAVAQWEAFERVPDIQAAGERRRIRAWRSRNKAKLATRQRERRHCRKLADDPLLQMES